MKSLSKNDDLNGYRLEDRLGGFGGREVWKAGTQEGVSVVLKCLYLGACDWQEYRLFEREIETLRSVSHSRIPTFVESFWEDDRLWLVQSYIEARSLASCTRMGQRFDTQTVVDIARQSLKVLCYLHGMAPPVIHRDIKTSNLLIDHKGQVYLTDFGTTQAVATASGVSHTSVGTFGYAPFEQFLGQAVPGSDLYALGITLAVLLSGIEASELPRNAEGSPDLSRLRLEHLDPRLRTWLVKMWAARPSDRWLTADTALAALNEVAVPSASLFLTTPTTVAEDDQPGGEASEKHDSFKEALTSRSEIRPFSSQSSEASRRRDAKIATTGLVGGVLGFVVAQTPYVITAFPGLETLTARLTIGLVSAMGVAIIFSMIAAARAFPDESL